MLTNPVTILSYEIVYHCGAKRSFYAKHNVNKPSYHPVIRDSLPLRSEAELLREAQCKQTGSPSFFRIYEKKMQMHSIKRGSLSLLRRGTGKPYPEAY